MKKILHFIKGKTDILPIIEKYGEFKYTKNHNGHTYGGYYIYSAIITDYKSFNTFTRQFLNKGNIIDKIKLKKGDIIELNKKSNFSKYECLNEVVFIVITNKITDNRYEYETFETAYKANRFSTQLKQMKAKELKQSA